MGGTDDPSNIIELTVEEHSQAHLMLYEQYGKKEDLCAYYMLSGKNKDPEFIKSRASIGGKASYQKRIEQGTSHLGYLGAELSEEQKFNISSSGGKIGGKRNAESGHMREIQKLSDCSAAGKKGSETCRKEKKNSFFDPVLRQKASVNGGKIQGKINAESGHLKKICKLSKRNTGMFWITNGTDSKLIRPGEIIEDGWRKGRVQKAKV